MFKKPLSGNEIPLGHDRDSYARGHAGKVFDGTKDDFFAHRAGAQRAENEDLAWLEHERSDRERWQQRDEERRRASTPSGGAANSSVEAWAFSFGLLARLIAWPVLTLFGAATIPVRLAADHDDAGPIRIALGVIAGFLFATGTLVACLLGWVWPGLGLIDLTIGPPPGQPTTIWVVLAIFLVWYSCLIPAWLVNRIARRQFEHLDARPIHPALRWYARAITGLGVLAWVTWLT